MVSGASSIALCTIVITVAPSTTCVHSVHSSQLQDPNYQSSAGCTCHVMNDLMSETAVGPNCSIHFSYSHLKRAFGLSQRTTARNALRFWQLPHLNLGHFGDCCNDTLNNPTQFCPGCTLYQEVKIFGVQRHREVPTNALTLAGCKLFSSYQHHNVRSPCGCADQSDSFVPSNSHQLRYYPRIGNVRDLVQVEQVRIPLTVPSRITRQRHQRHIHKCTIKLG